MHELLRGVWLAQLRKSTALLSASGPLFLTHQPCLLCCSNIQFVCRVVDLDVGCKLVDFLHLRSFVGGTLDLFQWREIIVVAQALVIVVDAETQFDHAVDSPSELCGLVKVEARCQQRCVEKEPDEILHGFVRFVGRRFF